MEILDLNHTGPLREIAGPETDPKGIGVLLSRAANLPSRTKSENRKKVFSQIGPIFLEYIR